jgi:cell division protein FtsB
MTSRAVVLLLVLAALVTTLALPIREFLQQRSAIGALQSQLAIGQARVDALREQRQKWHDPSFLEAQARARLHFVYPGEIGYVVLSPQDVKNAREPDMAVQQRSVTPWYDTLWSSVQQADQGP